MAFVVNFDGRSATLPEVSSFIDKITKMTGMKVFWQQFGVVFKDDFGKQITVDFGPLPWKNGKLDQQAQDFESWKDDIFVFLSQSGGLFLKTEVEGIQAAIKSIWPQASVYFAKLHHYQTFEKRHSATA